MASNNSARKLDCKDLHGYLKTLPSSVLDKLYNHPATCLAVFRQLPHLGRHYVMRMLFIEQPVSQAAVSLWVVNKHSNEHREATQALTELKVWYDQQIQGGLMGWILNTTYRENMKIALLGGGQSWTGCGALIPDKHPRDVDYLDKYALARWECVLRFMVGSTESGEPVSKEIIEVLLNAGLMKVESNDTTPSITLSGFQFLLMDTGNQVWYFMLQYLESVESRHLNLVECLSFLFQLSFSTLGKDYTTDGMIESQLRFLQHLREFGLVYQRTRKVQRYYPTRLAINLASGLSNFSSNNNRSGYLIVETNYRVYAYTDSPLQVALVALFCEMLYRFPTFAVGNLTRDSVREALMRGITAEQIISFLRSHVHPKMLKQTPVIPSVVTDQIRLWELERDRFKFTDGVLYNQFLSQNDYDTLRDYAQDLNVLVWGNTSKRVMVVSRNGHDEVKRYWKRLKQSNS